MSSCGGAPGLASRLVLSVGHRKDAAGGRTLEKRGHTIYMNLYFYVKGLFTPSIPTRNSRRGSRSCPRRPRSARQLSVFLMTETAVACRLERFHLSRHVQMSRRRQDPSCTISPLQQPVTFDPPAPSSSSQHHHRRIQRIILTWRETSMAGCIHHKAFVIIVRFSPSSSEPPPLSRPPF